jgi:hypothetical protein
MVSLFEMSFERRADVEKLTQMTQRPWPDKAFASYRKFTHDAFICLAWIGVLYHAGLQTACYTDSTDYPGGLAEMTYRFFIVLGLFAAWYLGVRVYFRCFHDHIMGKMPASARSRTTKNVITQAKAEKDAEKHWRTLRATTSAKYHKAFPHIHDDHSEDEDGQPFVKGHTKVDDLLAALKQAATQSPDQEP